MLARIERPLQKRCAGKQKREGGTDYDQHRFTPRLLIAHQPARSVNDKRERPEVFFVGGIFRHKDLICERMPARYLSILQIGK